MFINIQTGEAFVSAEEKTTYGMDGKSRKVYLLTREDGSKKEVSDTAFKAWFQEDHEAENREKSESKTRPFPTKKPLNTHQKIAAEQLQNAYDWIVGGYINTVQDGEAEEMPPVEDMFDEVMGEATTHKYGKGMCSQKPAPAAMNFAGKKFLVETLVKLFEDEGYEVPACCKGVPEKKQKQGSTRKYTDEAQAGEGEVVMRAFTGMLIGVFKIQKETKTYIMVKAANGKEMKFDKKTGLELNAKNPRFANRIAI